MFRYFKLGLTLLALVGMTALFSSPALAAGQTTAPTAKMTVQVDVATAPIFWKYNYLTKDGELGVPSTIKVSWAVGDGASRSSANRQVVVETGNTTGRVSIVTEKNALVDLQIQVRSAKDTLLGAYNLFVRNNGQTELITVTPPEYTEPTFTWGG